VGAKSAVVRYGYEVIKSWPHDRAAFTQGLVFRNGSFIESTGLNGQSTLREVEIESGRVVKQVALAPMYFGEGVAVLGGHAYQVTWQNRKGFVYDVDTFQGQKEFAYEDEGWGLTTDGRALILSDGTARIRFIDPASLAVQRTITVTLEDKPLGALNELEFIKGEIFANVWQTDDVVRIDPATGNVRGVISFAGLLAPQDRRADTDVLNGIAYDEKEDRLFVTGKRWPKVFEVRLKVQQ
jgi:glutamine cyclotransferase